MFLDILTTGKVGYKNINHEYHVTLLNYQILIKTFNWWIKAIIVHRSEQQ